jgi:Mre11 DNA-binding presumed domain.
MLAALDLLAVNHLVNYFGRHDEVDKVQVSPVLIQKGETKVALYGMGSMRDERLNRMWQGKKVRFLKPNPNDDERNNDDSDAEEEENNNEWFNIFALHQNRDLGRGSKNCVHESMIPEWMDLVVWGHEHECLIHPSESSVGTFRITQPGSSVATSLTEGESMRKHVGILDVRGSQFRMTAVPLMQVRSFVMGQIVLSESNVDPEDPRVEEAVGELLAKEVEKLAQQARKDSRLLLQRDVPVQAVAAGEKNGDGDCDLEEKLHYRVEKPNQVLVRLKVEHSGFSTLHNQRFGSQFVNDVVSDMFFLFLNDGTIDVYLASRLIFIHHVYILLYNHQANPSDILLFFRRRASSASSATSKKKSDKSKVDKSLMLEPIAPVELDEINIEDVIKDTLGSSDKKLQILDEYRLSVAVEDFVSKEQKGTIGETVGKIVTGQQRKLVRRGFDLDDDEGGLEKVSTANAVREACQADTQRIRDEDAISIEDEQMVEETFSPDAGNGKRPSRSVVANSTKKRSRAASISDESHDDEEMSEPSAKKRSSGRTTKPPTRNQNSRKNSMEDAPPTTTSRKAVSRKNSTRQNGISTKRRYTNSSSEEEEYSNNNDDDSEVEFVSTSQTRKNTTRTRQPSKRSKKATSYAEQSDDEEGPVWGIASTSPRRHRRY